MIHIFMYLYIIEREREREKKPRTQIGVYETAVRGDTCIEWNGAYDENTNYKRIS